MTGSAADDERLARAALLRVGEPNDRALWERVARDGATESLRRLRTGRSGMASAEQYRARLTRVDPEADLERAARAGARLVCPGDLEWPSQLEDLAGVAGPGGRAPAAPPLGVWVRGADLRVAALRAVAVVGARAATAYGGHVAAELAAALADLGFPVLSGGAYGIDASAHRGALAAGGSTVAVLACGVDVAYPRGHSQLFDRIAAEGVLVSELPPGCHPTRARFLDRNRLIAALCRGTVVVEAALRSGARNTMAWARALSRQVMAVPGPVTSALSQGCHAELRDHGATLVTDAGDVAALVGSLTEALPGPGAIEPSAGTAGPTRPQDLLDQVALRVLDAVPVRRGSPPARLAEVGGLSIDLVRQRLRQLELLGLVEQDTSGWRLARSAPPPRGGS